MIIRKINNLIKESNYFYKYEIDLEFKLYSELDEMPRSEFSNYFKNEFLASGEDYNISYEFSFIYIKYIGYYQATIILKTNNEINDSKNELYDLGLDLKKYINLELSSEFNGDVKVTNLSVDSLKEEY